jgi:hypothetical protein
MALVLDLVDHPRPNGCLERPLALAPAVRATYPPKVIAWDSATGSPRWPREGVASKVMRADYTRAGFSACSASEAPAGARNDRLEGGP